MFEIESDLAVVFLHHFGGSSRTWDRVMARLPGVQCIAPDLPGFGGSRVKENQYDLHEYASDVSRMLATTGVDRFVLVGHSMGGKIAVHAVAGGLPGLESLVLLAPSPPSPEPIADDARARLASTLERAAGADVVSSATARPLPKDIFERAVADVHRSDPAAWHAWLYDGSRQDVSAEVSELDVPTLVLSGTEDSNIAPSVVRREVVERIRGAVLRMIPGVGHLLPLEAPALVAAAIRNVVELRTSRRRREAATNQKGSAKRSVAHYPKRSVLPLLDSGAVTDATRRALLARLSASPSNDAVFFSRSQLETLRGVCAQLIPQSADRAPIELAGAVDDRLSHHKGNGWRYASMPPDGDAYRQSLDALDQTARVEVGKRFVDLDRSQRERLLRSLQDVEVGSAAWQGLSPRRFLEELLAEISDVYFSHPAVQMDIGYAGMADAKGWTRIGLDERHDSEPRATETSSG